MILSLVAAAVTTAQWLTVAKVVTVVGSTCLAIQPIADAYNCRN